LLIEAPYAARARMRRQPLSMQLRINPPSRQKPAHDAFRCV